MIPVADIAARKTFEHLAVGGGPVQEVDFYFTPGHPGVEQAHYHVVLWHVPKGTPSCNSTPAAAARTGSSASLRALHAPAPSCRRTSHRCGGRVHLRRAGAGG